MINKNFDILYPLRGERLTEIKSAAGAKYITERGKSFIDMFELQVILGQNNLRYNKVMIDAYRGLTAIRGKHKAKEELLSYLDHSTEGVFSGAHLTSSGSETVEAAVRIAKKLTGKTEIITFYNSVHGRTYLSSSLSGAPKRKVNYGPLTPGVIFFPFPNCSNCPYKKNSCDCGWFCFEQGEYIYNNTSARDVAAIIIEPIQGNGVIIPPSGYLKKMEEWAHKRDMLFIVDEIQTGMGRYGSMYVYQQEGLEPDMLLLGKALGNGRHISALLMKEVPSTENLMILTGGSGDEPIACRSACEVFAQLGDDLLRHVNEMGRELYKIINSLNGKPGVRSTRCRGLAAAVDFYEEETCHKVCDKLFDKGFLVGRSGQYLMCKPPYVIEKEQLRDFEKAIVTAI